MPKASPQQHSFNSGELSPLMSSRQDLEKYGNGMATCFNGIPMVQGGWTRRPGTVFFKTTKFGNAREVALQHFEYNVEQTYALEFGHLYVRFFTATGILAEDPVTITDITEADPGVVTATSHGYSNGDRVQLAGIVGMTQLNGQEVIVANKTTHTFEIQDIYGNDIDTSVYDDYISGGTASQIFELVTPYTEDDLPDIRVTQSADILYIFHPDHEPAELIREEPLTWSLDEWVSQDGPYFPINTTAVTLTLSGTSGSVNVTASSVAAINFGAGFLATDVGRLIRWLDPAGDWTWLEITELTSTTVVVATIHGQAASAGTATTNWRLGLYSDTTGFPRVGSFHENRLYMAGAALSPQRLDGSKSADFSNFAPTDKDGLVASDNAVSFSLASGRVNTVRWMESHSRGLLIGTAGGEWTVRASTLDEVITPTNINARESSVFGSVGIEPERVGDVVLFLQRGSRKLREFAYLFEADGFQAPDLTVLAEQVSLTGITGMHMQKQPQPILWATRTDGLLVGLTYDRAQNVIGWHRHQLGGVSDSSGNPTKVENVAVLPSPDDLQEDTVFVTTLRYINGRQERFVEELTKIWETGDEQTDAFYGDCGLTVVSGGGTDEVTGAYHLEGETVGVWVDGAAHPDVVVTDGKITLDSEYNIITYGLRYNSDGETMPIEAGAADGSAQTKIKRVSRLGFILLDTLGLKYGADENSLTEILFRLWGQDWGTATPMFTGAVRERFESDFDRLGQVFFRADTMAPATVLGLTMQLNTEDNS